MNEKMVRFLNSLGIENLDDFDLDFEMIGRNRFNKQQWDMVIVKTKPWKYHLLRQFQDGLINITYPYSLRFSYLVRPDYTDALSLFADWYQTIYRLPHNLVISGDEEDHLFVEYLNQSEKEQYSQAIADFREFLNFINYEFTITETIKPIDEERVEVSARQLKKIVKNAEIEAVETMIDISEKPEIVDRNDAIDVAEEERKDLKEKVEAAYLDIMKRNAEEMAKERRRARLNRRGNYEPIERIDSINENSGNVDFSGQIFSLETKEFGDSTKITIGVADNFGGAIMVGAYQNKEIPAETIALLDKGVNVRICGAAYMDNFSKEVTIKVHYIYPLPPDVIAPDEEPVKRVELHLHSAMSNMDGVTSMDDYCKYAKALGHQAIAITDHAVVQGYPDAQKAAKKNGLKMLYGAELYMVDDKLNYINNPVNVPLNKAKYVVLDLETTGLSSRYDSIIEFGAVRVEHGLVTSHFDVLINPGFSIPRHITEITGIKDDMLKDKPTIGEAIKDILEFLDDAILVTHNAEFDISFLQESLVKLGLPPLNNSTIDTLSLSRFLFPDSKRHTLGALCRNLEVNYDEEQAHRADYDAQVLNDVLQPMISRLIRQYNILTHADLEKLETPPELLKHIFPVHISVLAKDKAGLKDLYKMISLSHIDYLAEVPKIPRREVERYRSHLLIGSACFNGEVFRTARYYNAQRLKEVMEFYDYIEIQPIPNYSYLVNMGELTDEAVKKYLSDIVETASQIGKITVATGDVHYLTPKEKIYRDIYISAKGLGGINHALNPYARSKMPPFENPDQHYRTTKEMLECMDFLGKEKAYEITVINTNKIADMIDAIIPLPNDKLYSPKIENSEQMLTDLCYKKAHELYGNPLPKPIQDRLDTELHGIISNGYSVIYYIAHKIVKKTNDDDYIVGSRGSVGSSFAATMAGITEVNPLPPHYLCAHCHHLEWTSETMPEYRSGYDLPEKKCPICGEPMIHDGQNIPFETFLGFHAEKTPDIDLNFPRDYQSRAHDYTKELLGENNVFRAGTIETVKDKTAFGFARGYIERKGLDPNTFSKAKIAYYASGCIGVKRTTGQHPGGIVVIPNEYEVYDFTPIQYPADEPESSWKTTHFDFHSIHDTILKLDLLGHVDPMALRMMSKLTNINVEDIPLNDKDTLSIFSSAKALGMKNDYLASKTGAMGIPEFGTSFVRGILEETNPKTFSDLVIISGLSHGTGVWQDNAESLINSHKASLQEVIGCRDDIMTYLINKGLPAAVSFSIMESVRHGNGLKPEFVEIMKANKVPQYYIDSCNLIKYMFPKGHAVAYVTMAIRVGYFKVHYPLEYYATFFSVRSKQYDIFAMIKGRDAIINRLDELKLKSKSKTDKLSPKEADQIVTLQIALEMVQRGYKFENINLYKSDVTDFIVDHQNKALIPPFTTIDGLGENNAVTVIEARKEGKFFSQEDLLRRTKLTTTNVKDLSELGVLDGMSETDQMLLFDLSDLA
ncbi:MAG TPA: PolC-type DNA polymerase III [Bacilli bacterium]|mgnify:CR=1 FL=1|nr:PolC-type DNA polymerase III [Bacilli bacterium]HPS18804.1 PolC-type DNA polymerase III [Bacilli bacterium]